jgi:AcrR family transcriptional regulator
MPIVVNKEEKVLMICQKAYEEFVNNGIDNISLNQLISNIGISKGQFYHYFKTKEDLIFEVMSHKTIEGFEFCDNTLKQSKSLEESLLILFSFYISEEKYFSDLRKVLFDCLHIFTHTSKDEIKNYNTEYYRWIDNKLIEVFQFHNIENVSETIIKSLSSTADGMYLRSLADNSFSLQSKLEIFLIDIAKRVEKGK